MDIVGIAQCYSKAQRKPTNMLKPPYILLIFTGYIGLNIQVLSQKVSKNAQTDKGSIQLNYQVGYRWFRPSYSLTRDRFECDCGLMRQGETVMKLCPHVLKMAEIFEKVLDKTMVKIKRFDHGLMTTEVFEYEQQEIKTTLKVLSEQ